MKKVRLFSKKISKYIQCAWMGRKSQVTYKGIIADKVLGLGVQFIVLYFFWKAVYSEKTVICNMSFSEITLYLSLSISINALFIYPSIYFMSQDIKTGNIIYLLIKPIDYQIQFICKHIGVFIFMATLIIPSFIVFSLITGNILIPKNMMFFFISLIFGLLTMITFNFILGTICFWTENSDGISFFQAILFEILSGTLIPLEFLPIQFKNIIDLLPFRGIVYTPISIFLHNYSNYEFLTYSLFQVSWIIALAIIGRRLFIKARGIAMINGG